MTTLTLREGVPGRVDLAGILPDTLAGLAPAAISTLSLEHDGRRVALGELFEVEGGDPDTLLIQCDRACLDNLGAGLGRGRLIVEGPAGDGAGRAMSGGQLLLGGDAGDFLASAMRGGTIHVAGNVGDWLGAAPIGERTGMAGGVVAVAGSVGARAGDRMRRGLILIRGQAGEYCGSRLLAGTLVVAGGCGALAGFGLRRGTLVLGRPPLHLPATFNDAGPVELTYLGLLGRHAEGILPSVLPTGTRVRRYVGDLAFGGKGEVLVPA